MTPNVNSPAAQPARDALTAWVTEHIPESQRRELSGHIARFVAEAVRADRAKQAATEDARRRARESVRKVRDLARPHGGYNLADALGL